MGSTSTFLLRKKIKVEVDGFYVHFSIMKEDKNGKLNLFKKFKPCHPGRFF